MFVGRKREMEFLQKCYDSPKAELVVIYGRRRIGKTELLKQFSHGKQAVFY
ncbi:MAG: ATP-binding protein, partial [Selenomonas sp.]|nr:ATP-binding protein [Selenomonas sp.]